MSDALLGIIIAAAVGGFGGYVSNTLLDKGRYRRDYQKEIIKKKIEAFQNLSTHIVECRDIFIDEKNKRRANKNDFAEELDKLFARKFTRDYIFLTKEIINELENFKDDVQSFIYEYQKNKIKKENFKKVTDKLTVLMNKLHNEVWDKKSIKF